MVYRWHSWIYGFEKATHVPLLIKATLCHDFQAITSIQYQDYGEKVGGAGEGGVEYTPPANLVFIWKLPWGFSIILPPYPGWPWRESPRPQRSMQSRLSPLSPPSSHHWLPLATQGSLPSPSHFPSLSPWLLLTHPSSFLTPLQLAL